MAAKWGLIGGLVAGAAAGLLLAPKSGKVTRRWAKTKTGNYINQGREKFTRKKVGD